MNKLQAYSHLLRLHAPTGYMLLFLPCLFGLGISITLPGDLWYVLLFFTGALVMRSAGCIINDICDRKIDAHVERTKNRPLANGTLSVKEAVVILAILMLLGFSILLTLSKLSIIIGFCVVPIIIIYPLMKRITHFPQFFLGISFGGIGALISYATITNELDLKVILLYIGCIFWTLGYDCIYAFIDMEDDKKIGVKSIAIFLHNRNYIRWLACFYVTFISLFLGSAILSGTNFYIILLGCIIALSMLLWQVFTLDILKRENCMKRFKNNSYVGLVLGIFLVTAKLLYI